MGSNVDQFDSDQKIFRTLSAPILNPPTVHSEKFANGTYPKVGLDPNKRESTQEEQ